VCRRSAQQEVSSRGPPFDLVAFPALVRFVLTAAHCVCTHFLCGVDEDSGKRLSDFDPGDNIKVSGERRDA